MDWENMTGRTKGLITAGCASVLMLLASAGIWGTMGFLIVLLILSVVGLIAGIGIAIED